MIKVKDETDGIYKAKDVGDPLKVTHGMGTNFVDSRGIKRYMGLTHYTDNSYQLHFETWWGGPNELPMKTAVRLNTELFGILTSMITESMFNLDNYKLVDTKDEASDSE